MIDYRKLLWKYIQNVGNREGVTFIHRNGPENLTDEEKEELIKLDAMTEKYETKTEENM